MGYDTFAEFDDGSVEIAAMKSDDTTESQPDSAKHTLHEHDNFHACKHLGT